MVVTAAGAPGGHGDPGTLGLLGVHQEAVWPLSAGMLGPKSLPQPRAYSHGAFLPQIKVEEDFGFEADEALDSSWVSRGPDKLLPYPTLASPPFD